MDELVDIITPDHTPLHVASKHHAHQHGLLHHVVIGVMRDINGNRTVVRQSADRQDAGQFVNPVGGHVQAGESLHQALRREAQEEIGWNNPTITPIGSGIFSRTVLGRHENHMFNVFFIYSDEPIILNAESVELKTFTAAEYLHIYQSQPRLFGDAHHFVENTFADTLLAPILT